MDGSKVLDGLNKQRQKDILCDVRLQVDGQLFLAHKSVLAAASPYFEAMFTGGFKEACADPVILSNISHVGLKEILNAIYTSKLHLTLENISLILPTVHLFQMNDAVKFCGRFMEENVNLESCLEFLQLSEKYNLEQAMVAADRFLIENFVQLSRMEEFMDISKEALCRYLSDDTLMLNGEEIEAFRASMRWVNVMPEERIHDLPDVMANVRFCKIPVNLLMDEVLKVPIIENNKSCRDLILDAVRYHTNIYSQPLQTGNQVKSRGEQGLVLIGQGRRDNNLHYSVENRPTEFWLTSFPDPCKQQYSTIETPFVYGSLCSVHCGNFLFLFGVDNRSFSPVTMRYDASGNTWISLESVPRQAAVGYTAVVHDNNIILLGGLAIDRKSTEGMERNKLQDWMFTYSIRDNKWKQDSTLHDPRAFMGSTSYNGTIYVAGGMTKYEVYFDRGHNSRELYSFQSENKVWFRKANMWNDRSNFCFEAHDGKLYAVGGYRMMSPSYPSTEVPDVEIYDIEVGSWTLIKSLLPEFCLSASGATSHVVGDKIYVLGGCRPAIEGLSSKKISYFDTTLQQVTTLDKVELPKLCCRHASGLLTLPKKMKSSYHSSGDVSHQLVHFN